MANTIDIQHISRNVPPVEDLMLCSFIQSVLPASLKSHHVTLRLVDPDEMIALNNTYRKQNKPTNVLAFPSTLPPEVMKEYPYLGDIIVCPDVLEHESQEQNVPIVAHWAHIIIHGTLHLLGHDHQAEEDTARMQALEVQALLQFGFNNPYQ